MKTAVLLGSLLLASFAFAQEYEERTFAEPDGGKLPYRLLKPANYDASQKYPLVVLLHGAGERGNDNKKQLKWGSSLFTKADVQAKYPAFVLIPQCPENQKWVDVDWAADDGNAPADASPMEKLVLETVDELAKEFSIDPDRHYITGMSMGGYGTWDLITRYPERWAAAVPICGGGDKTKAAEAKKVPVWAFHGSADAVVKPVRTKLMVDALKAAHGAVASTLYPGVGHDSWTLAYAEPNLLSWMFSQKRGARPQKMDLATSPLTMLAMPEPSIFPGVGPVQNVDWFKKLWMQRRTEFSLAKEEERGAVVFLGDSITQGWGTLAGDFPDFKVANRGISGDTSRGVRYRLREDVMELQPKAVSILIGTNDLALGAEPEQVIENIKAIIAELQKQNPNVPIVLNHVMPRKPEPGKFPDKIVKLNKLMDALAATDKRLAVCDSWSIFDDGKGSCKKEEFPDMLHPNKAGYDKWRAALSTVFAKAKVE